MLAEKKAAQRQALREARSLLDPQDETTAAGFLRTGLDLVTQLKLSPAGQAIAAYMPIGSEPDITSLMTELHRQGREIYLPICEADYQLSWCRWQPDIALQRSTFSWVLEPVGERLGIDIMATVGVLLIPALAVDGCGVRLGQGGGYYDRFLAALAQLENSWAPNSPRAVRAAVVYSAELLQAGEIAADELDQPVDYALTEEFFQRLEC
ncbi:5-formyltetrahydrofolate cyclo-ligase [Psychromicrobium lacuslunae]|uniref:5-formyltetrahydrofolate cyclo-ligase n=1 Tax=Psychromicrobium lacuslunae TaxID=1618207 RepID=UPI0006966977|nr:5-formyltetrahydrofolate cyclo-ligase [Psychromicrobium lacuslunae]